MRLFCLSALVALFFVAGCGNNHICKGYYNDRSLEYEVPCNRWNGVFNGEMKIYYKNGNLRAIKYYVDDLEEDTSQFFFYRSGNILKTVPMVAGKRQGVAQTFRDDGTLELEQTFDNGQANGETRSYYPDGEQIQEIRTFTQDVLHGYFAAFRANGTLIREGQYSNEKAAGPWSFYNEKGIKVGEITFASGIKHGAFALFRPNAIPFVTGEFTGGLINGMVTWYNKEGAIIQREEWVRGEPARSFQGGTGDRRYGPEVSWLRSSDRTFYIRNDSVWIEIAPPA